MNRNGHNRLKNLRLLDEQPVPQVPLIGRIIRTDADWMGMTTALVTNCAWLSEFESAAKVREEFLRIAGQPTAPEGLYVLEALEECERHQKAIRLLKDKLRLAKELPTTEDDPDG